MKQEQVLKTMQPYIGKKCEVRCINDGFALFCLGKLLVSTFFEKNTAFYAPREKLEPHIHCNDIQCVFYGNDTAIFNIAIECNDCSEVLWDYDFY